MKLLFWLDGKPTAGEIGVVEGYIQEGINEMSLIELVLVSNAPLEANECRDLLGKPCRVVFAGNVNGDWQYSRFDGLVYEFHAMDKVSVDKDLFKYQMIVRPMAWVTNYNVMATSYTNISKPDVVKKILLSSQLKEGTHFEFKCNLPKMFLTHRQILQNQSSDMVFIENLLKESGINFYFGTDEKKENANEKMKITNYFSYANRSDYGIIPYNPNSSQIPGSYANGYRLFSFETHYRAIPKSVMSIADLGDGLATTRKTSLDTKGGLAGQFRHFTADGEIVEDCFVKKNDTISRTEYFEINRAVFEGRSNHPMFRSGEVFVMDDAASACDRHVLITHCFHHFRQTANSALSAMNDVDLDSDIEYTNLFSGVDGDVNNNNALNYRPDQTYGKTMVELRRAFSSMHSVLRDDRESPRYDIDEIERYNLKKKVAALEAELSFSRELSGLLVGEVTEDASVSVDESTGKKRDELICKVKCDRFPEPITVKVALGWLTTQGWMSLLPRAGTQVYFQFINGADGQNEAVLVGYRPHGSMPVHDPDKTTTSKKLGAGSPPKLGEEAKNVVGKSTFAPKNKHRQALLGEGAVAEVAVIDGGEDTVYMHANNRICINGDKAVNIAAGSLCESAGSASQQFGSLNRGVTGDQKVGISKNLERWVGGTTDERTEGDLKISSETGLIDVYGCKSIQLHDEDGAQSTVNGKQVFMMTANQNHVTVDPEYVNALGKNSKLYMKKDFCTFFVEDYNTSIQISKNNTKVKAGKAEIVLDKATGKVAIFGNDMEVKGSNLYVKGDNVSVKGKPVYINCSVPPDPPQKPADQPPNPPGTPAKPESKK